MTAPNAFVTGWPIKHSLSPLVHGYWLEAMNIAGNYEAVAVEPENLSEFLQSLRDGEYIGGNVTIPHKEAAFAGADHRDEISTLLGAANTLWVEDGKLYATNTDAYGFVANLDEFAPAWRASTRAMVLGAGGAARAVIYALIDAGIKEISIANRTKSKADDLAALFQNFAAKKSCILQTTELDAVDCTGCDFLVNTTALGMVGQSKLEIDINTLNPNSIVTDIVYNPLQTELLLQASQRGHKSVDGIGMLLHQAVPGFEKWFGVRPVVTAELRTHILNKLAGRNS